jgi:hypothetical protein
MIIADQIFLYHLHNIQCSQLCANIQFNFTPQYEKCSLVQVIISPTLVINDGSHLEPHGDAQGLLVDKQSQGNTHYIKKNSLHQQQ